MGNGINELGEGQLLLYLICLDLILHLIFTLSWYPGDQMTSMWKVRYETVCASGYILQLIANYDVTKVGEAGLRPVRNHLFSAVTVTGAPEGPARLSPGLPAPLGLRKLLRFLSSVILEFITTLSSECSKSSRSSRNEI